MVMGYTHVNHPEGGFDMKDKITAEVTAAQRFQLVAPFWSPTKMQQRLWRSETRSPSRPDFQKGLEAVSDSVPGRRFSGSVTP